MLGRSLSLKNGAHPEHAVRSFNSNDFHPIRCELFKIHVLFIPSNSHGALAIAFAIGNISVSADSLFKN